MKALKGRKPLKGRPGEALKPIDLEAKRAEAEAQMPGVKVDDEDLCSYLMYETVYLDYMGRRRKYGPVRVLPTSVFFYGMEVGHEIAVDLEPGKTLVLRLLGVGETDDEGEKRVFFELNGQPRTVRVPDRSAAASAQRRPKATIGDPNHVAAPMPGLVAAISVTPGQRVKKGDLLLTIEAMKMETAIHAERDGEVEAVHVTPGAQIDAKDLLVQFAPA